MRPTVTHAQLSSRTCAADVDGETRSATDNICRAARSITQTATDLESYVLKRFPLSPEPEYTAWVHGENLNHGFPAAVVVNPNVGKASEQSGHHAIQADHMPAAHANKSRAKPLFVAPGRTPVTPNMRSKDASAFQGATGPPQTQVLSASTDEVRDALFAPVSVPYSTK